MKVGFRNALGCRVFFFFFSGCVGREVGEKSSGSKGDEVDGAGGLR